MNVTPARKAEQKIAARWGGNVARLLKEKNLKLCELGRLLDPEVKNPTSTAYALIHRHTMPDDKTCCAVAAFLGVSKEALHAGELPELRPTQRRAVRPSGDVKPNPGPAAPSAFAPDTIIDCDPLQDFLLSALKRKLDAMGAAERYGILREMARLCVEATA